MCIYVTESCDVRPFNFDVVYYETYKKWLSFLYVNHNGFSVFMCAFVQIDELMWLNLVVLHGQLWKGYLGVWLLMRKWTRHSWLQGPCLVMWINDKQHVYDFEECHTYFAYVFVMSWFDFRDSLLFSNGRSYSMLFV